MGDKEWEPANVFDVFGDPIVRRILVLTSETPRSAGALAEALDVSLPTVYRRTNRLVETDLMTYHRRADEQKNRYKVFETTLKEISYEIDDGEFRVETRTRRRVGDDFDACWSERDRSDTGSTDDASSPSSTDPDVDEESGDGSRQHGVSL
ncbi:winged helix-turn-helix domain-containing protein [Halorubrum sp. DTA98]|uniref:winged helix-turn-helix domain-containing protein n=1 Tax=Halorubrum sp. DTA98 TaxID=3402163 RepID=UPI003AACA6F5